MGFSEKYISIADNLIKPDAAKIVLSNDFYAIGEMINELISKIEHLRIALLR